MLQTSLTDTHRYIRLTNTLKIEMLKSKRQNVKISWESCEEIRGTVPYLYSTLKGKYFLFVGCLKN